MRNSTLVGPSGAEAAFFVIFVNGGNPTGFFAPLTKITPAERRRGEMAQKTAPGMQPGAVVDQGESQVLSDCPSNRL